MLQVPLEGPIAVIDDDLRTWRVSDFDGLQDVLGDPDVDTFRKLWDFAVKQDLVADTEDNDEKLSRLGQNNIINQIVTSKSFAEEHPEVWDQIFHATVEARESALDWYRSVLEAAAAHDAEVINYSSHPAYNDLSDVKVIVIDLIVDDDPNPLGKVTAYLKGLYADRRTRSESLPLVILVSQNAAELAQHRQDFRQNAQISASMLRILDKAKMGHATQGAVRFELLWQQMVDEQGLANVTSKLIAAIGAAAKEANADITRLTWNLDCDALLRMYQTCIDDGAEFSDHLIDFIARSVAWQIRGHHQLRTVLNDVEAKLQERATSGPNELARRFHSAGQEDEAAMRELLHRFHWVPRQPVRLSDLSLGALRDALAQNIPYGAVLAFDQVQVDQQVYVHITQPCDLLRFHDRFDTDSLFFVEGNVIDYGEAGGRSPAKWIVRALKSSEQFFDIEVLLKRAFAMSAHESIETLKTREAMIVGQLRPDTAREVSQQLARHVSRIDQPKFTDMQSVRYNVLIGKKQNRAAFFMKGPEDRFSVRAILRTLPGKKECFHLLDGAPVQLALYCQQEFGDTGLRATDVADALKGEIKVGQTHVDLGDHCDIRVIGDANGVKRALRGMNSNKDVGIVLVPEEVAGTIKP